jgi:hypothetical protein
VEKLVNNADLLEDLYNAMDELSDPEQGKDFLPEQEAHLISERNKLVELIQKELDQPIDRPDVLCDPADLDDPEESNAPADSDDPKEPNAPTDPDEPKHPDAPPDPNKPKDQDAFAAPEKPQDQDAALKIISDIKSFQHITGTNSQDAHNFLSKCSWNLQVAISRYFDEQTNPDESQNTSDHSPEQLTMITRFRDVTDTTFDDASDFLQAANWNYGAALCHFYNDQEAANEPASADKEDGEVEEGPPMPPEHHDAINRFIGATGVEYETADSWLVASDWNYDVAVSKYCANQAAAITDRPTNHIPVGYDLHKRQAVSSDYELVAAMRSREETKNGLVAVLEQTLRARDEMTASLPQCINKEKPNAADILNSALHMFSNGCEHSKAGKGSKTNEEEPNATRVDKMDMSNVLNPNSPTDQGEEEDYRANTRIARAYNGLRIRVDALNEFFSHVDPLVGIPFQQYQAMRRRHQIQYRSQQEAKVSSDHQPGNPQREEGSDEECPGETCTGQQCPGERNPPPDELDIASNQDTMPAPGSAVKYNGWTPINIPQVLEADVDAIYEDDAALAKRLQMEDDEAMARKIYEEQQNEAPQWLAINAHTDPSVSNTGYPQPRPRSDSLEVGTGDCPRLYDETVLGSSPPTNSFADPPPSPEPHDIILDDGLKEGVDEALTLTTNYGTGTSILQNDEDGAPLERQPPRDRVLMPPPPHSEAELEQGFEDGWSDDAEGETDVDAEGDTEDDEDMGLDVVADDDDEERTLFPMDEDAKVPSKPPRTETHIVDLGSPAPSSEQGKETQVSKVDEEEPMFPMDEDVDMDAKISKVDEEMEMMFRMDDDADAGGNVQGEGETETRILKVDEEEEWYAQVDEKWQKLKKDKLDGSGSPFWDINNP